MTAELERSTEKNLRVTFTQSTKGLWTAKFGASADGCPELQDKLDELQNAVIARLAALNTNGTIGGYDG